MTILFNEKSQYISGQVFGFIVILKRKKELFYIKMVQILVKILTTDSIFISTPPILKAHCSSCVCIPLGRTVTIQINNS